MEQQPGADRADSGDDDRSYHFDRAMQEIARGLEAASGPIATAHFKLAGLHMTRARELGCEPSQQDLRLLSLLVA